MRQLESNKRQKHSVITNDNEIAYISKPLGARVDINENLICVCTSKSLFISFAKPLDFVSSSNIAAKYEELRLMQMKARC